MSAAISTNLALALAALFAVATAGRAQPAFEVASLKPSPPANGPTYNANMGRISHGTLTMTNVTLCDCVRLAYSIPTDFQIEGPDWIKNKDIRFHITAKADPDAPRSQILLMLQNLLVERFHMAIHHEQRRLGYLALLPGKGPNKLTVEPPSADFAGSIRLGRMYLRQSTLSQLTYFISRFTHQPIIDMTGIPGEFTIRLHWAPDEPQAAPAPDAAAQPGIDSEPSLFRAVEEQLGLKLETRHGPVEVLVVDRAEKVPAGN